MLYKSLIPSNLLWTLEIDLQEDFRMIIYKDLKKAGYSDATKDDAVYQYYNLRKRQIEPKPRMVLYSKEFQCPAGYEAALREFVQKAECGENLKPYQTEKIKEVSYSDLLLNDWNIHHFHLSRWKRDDGFIARSQFLIFAYVTDGIIYMIQVYPHKNDAGFYKQEMVRILRDNWPDLMKPFRIEGAYRLTEKLDDTQYRSIRSTNTLTFVDLGPNEVYGMIGGGYASNGASTDAVRQSNYWMNRLGVFQLVLLNDAAWIGKTINRVIDREIQFCNMVIKLLWIDSKDKVTTCETNSGLIVQVDMKENWLRICRPYEVFG